MAESLPSTRDDAIVASAADYAVKFHQLGMLAEAEKFYAAILQAKPDHFDALRLLGVLRQQQGNNAEALRLTGEALKANSRSAISLRNFGAALARLDRHEEARAVYDKAVSVSRERCEALVNHGVALVSLHRLPEAIAAFDEALAINEDHVEARVNRGIALIQLGRAREGLEVFDVLLAANGSYPEALVGRGVALTHLRRPHEALAAFDQAIEVQPDHSAALSNRVLALVALRRHAEVLDACDRVLTVNPRDAEVLYTRGDALRYLDKLEAAVESYEQAWRLGHARSLSVLALCPLMLADWTRVGKFSAVLSQHIAEGDCIYPFAAVAYGLGPRDQLKAATNYLRTCLPDAPKPLTRTPAGRPDKLRIAYLSSDFRRHAVAFAIADLLERHDRTEFEIVGVSLGPNDASPVRSRIVNSLDRFHDAACESDEAVAELLQSLEVHIAVDLNGPTEGSRPGILAYRPAPIQAVYLGYPGTTGADFIDYILADDTVLPFDQHPFFSEKIVHLPDCYHANDTTRRISPTTPTRCELSLPAQAFVFCCFNRSMKLSALVFDVWMRLLARLDGSVLWLSATNDPAQANLRREAAARGIDPARLIFAPFAGRIEDHLARHRAADLFLDTLPYNAHSTACDALFAGLPVVTCAGASFAGRVGASMLKAANLPELVTNSLEDYEALAFELATDRNRLASIRRKLEENRLTCPLFDGERFRRNVEAAYTAMWDIHQRGESPRSFRVEPNP